MNVSTLVAFFLHVAGLSLLFLIPAAPLVITPTQQKIVVQTIKLTPVTPVVAQVASVPEPSEESAPQEPEPVQEVPEPQPEPKKVIKSEKKAGPKKPKPKQKPAPKPAQKDTKPDPKAAAKQKLLQEAKESLMAMQNSSGSASKIEMPKSNYSDSLAKEIKKQLVLPEYGEVKIKLTLNRSGRVISVQVLQSESKANENLVKKSLNGVTFSPFDNHFTSENEHSFVIVLSNDI